LVAAGEEALSGRRGLSPVDYQWVQREEADGLSRLVLRIDPSARDVDSADVVKAVYGALQGTRSGSLAARVWQQAGTVKLVREPIPITSRGKTLPFVQEV
jgi:hypothetical protein